MRPVVALGGVFIVGVAIWGLVQWQSENRDLKDCRDCEHQLHLLAKSLETARWNARPHRYVTCLAELEQIEGKRNPIYDQYRYRVDGDGQGYELLCKTGHGDRWPAYNPRRGLYQGSPLR